MFACFDFNCAAERKGAEFGYTQLAGRECEIQSRDIYAPDLVAWITI